MTLEAAMRLALATADPARGSTSPNPTVGAVILRDGEVIGSGHTQPIGGAHAEVTALADCRQRGHDPRGATMVVTLEPCGHHGRTPPCVDALLDAGIARVVVGQVDPTEPMRGRSLARLREAGVEVVQGVMGDACADHLLGWMRAVSLGLPEVTIKTATSADGAIATATGESQWITGPEARAAGRQFRATHDAILVGIGTVLADDPRLTARIEGALDPVAVVLDSRGRFPVGCALDREGTLVFGGGEPHPDHKATFVRCALGADGRTDVELVLRALVERGLHRVLVEGGGEVVRSLLDARLVDRVEQFQAGVVLPGGRPWVGGPALGTLGGAVRMTLDETSRVGDDAWLRWRVHHRHGTTNR